MDSQEARFLYTEIHAASRLNFITAELCYKDYYNHYNH